MGNEKKDFAELTRKEFLYWSGLGVAGATLVGIPELGYGSEKKPKYGGRLRVGERHGSSGLDAHKNQVFMDFNNYTLMYVHSGERTGGKFGQSQRASGGSRTPEWV